MSPVRALARPLLASVFIVDGLDSIRHADKHAQRARPYEKTLAKLSAHVPGLPADPKSLARITGAISVGAGVLLATGKAPRLAATVLAVIAVPTTLMNYPVTSVKGEQRREYLSGALRNVALIGGLIFAAEDRRGKPSLGWRYANWQDHRAEISDVKEALKTDVKAAKASA